MVVAVVEQDHETESVRKMAYSPPPVVSTAVDNCRRKSYFVIPMGHAMVQLGRTPPVLQTTVALKLPSPCVAMHSLQHDEKCKTVKLVVQSAMIEYHILELAMTVFQSLVWAHATLGTKEIHAAE